jgi:O-antigen/teichoic acid export membrane protein
MITSILTIIFLIFTVTFLANGLGAEEFGAYSLARRILSLIEPLATACIAFSLTRYTAMSKENNFAKDYLMSATVLVTSLSLLILIVGLIFQSSLSRFIFNTNAYDNLYLATLCMIVTYSLYILIYSYYRGLGRMQLANFWQIALIGLGPFLIALQFSSYQSSSLVMILMAGLLSAAIIPLIGELSFTGLKRVFSKKNTEMRELLKYGLPRVPGIFAYNAMFFIGPFLSASTGNLKGSGFLMLGQLILRIIEGGMEAFSRVAFPKIAELFKNSGKQQIMNKVVDFLAMIAHLGLFFSFQVFIWSEKLIFFWLGSDYQEAVLYIQIFSLGTLPYLAFICLRNIIDAIEVEAVITKYLFIALTATSILSVIGAQSKHATLILSIAFVLGLFIMGYLVAAKIIKDFSVSLLALNIPQSLLYNIFIIVIAYYLNFALADTESGVAFFACFLGFQTSIFMLYLLLLHLGGVSWVARIADRVIQR